MAEMSRDDLLDALFDLQHDLGKYLCLPLSWLPPEATPEEVRQATLKALLETRSGPAGNRSAADLWETFLEEVGEELQSAQQWPALNAAVSRALAWTETAQRADAPPSRPIITKDFTRVAETIRDLIKELSNG